MIRNGVAANVLELPQGTIKGNVMVFTCRVLGTDCPGASNFSLFQTVFCLII